MSEMKNLTWITDTLGNKLSFTKRDLISPITAEDIKTSKVHIHARSNLERIYEVTSYTVEGKSPCPYKFFFDDTCFSNGTICHNIGLSIGTMICSQKEQPSGKTRFIYAIDHKAIIQLTELKLLHDAIIEDITDANKHLPFALIVPLKDCIGPPVFTIEGINGFFHIARLGDAMDPNDKLYEAIATPFRKAGQFRKLNKTEEDAIWARTT